jgi:hypothetical protein
MSCWSILLSFHLPANHGTIYKIVIPAMESQFSLFDSIFNPWKCQEVCQRHVYGLLYIQTFVTMGASTYFMSLYRSKVPTLKQRREWERLHLLTKAALICDRSASHKLHCMFPCWHSNLHPATYEITARKAWVHKSVNVEIFALWHLSIAKTFADSQE